MRGWINEQIDAWIYAYIGGQMDRWIDEWVDG